MIPATLPPASRTGSTDISGRAVFHQVEGLGRHSAPYVDNDGICGHSFIDFNIEQVFMLLNGPPQVPIGENSQEFARVGDNEDGSNRLLRQGYERLAHRRAAYYHRQVLPRMHDVF